MFRKSIIPVLALLLARAASAATETPPIPAAEALAGSARALGSLLGMLSLFLVSLAVSGGVLALAVMALSAEPSRRELEALEATAGRAPRKCAAVGLATFVAGSLVAVVLLQLAPLRLFGAAVALLLAIASVKGLLSRVVAAGRSIGRNWPTRSASLVRDAALGTAAFELVFLFPVIGQVFVACAALQGLGAYMLNLLIRNPTPAASTAMAGDGLAGSPENP